MKPNALSLALGLALIASPVAVFAQDANASASDGSQQTTDDSANAPAADDQAAPATDSQDASADAAPATQDDAAAEEEPASNLTWNLSVTSDYVFRGISQSNRKPALQGGLDYAFGDSGFYVGTWGSNIDFQDADGPDIEIDTYVGWNHDLSDDWNLDLMATRYNYFGARDVYGDIDYNEFIGKIAYHDMYTFEVGYANDYANSGYSSLYYNLSGSWDVGNDFSLSAGVGHTDFSDGVEGYNDWNIGLTRQFGPVEASLNYYDTNVSGPRLSDSLVLSFKIGG